MRRPAPRIGCSGWNYRAWKGRFYPDTLPTARWLHYYARVFDTVEVNNTFYRLPEASVFAAWRRELPAGFTMSVKASRFLTHMKRLTHPEEPLQRLLSRAAALERSLGPLLYQLPPNMGLNLERLEAFLEVLPRTWNGKRLRHVVEFRHPSWYESETFTLLARHHVSLCLHDKLGSTIREPQVGPLVYVRFHGTSGHYRGSYGRPALERWAHQLAEHWQDGRQVYAYFNNDPDAVATENARTLRELLFRAIDIDHEPMKSPASAPA